VEAPEFSTGQEQATNSVWVTRPRFKPVPKMDRAEFVFIGSLDAIVSQGDCDRTIMQGAPSCTFRYKFAP
jgi:hypothetical protein